jgi:hypothetical protein
MAKSLKQLLSEPDDSKLCDDLFMRIVEYHGDDFDVRDINEQERVVILVEHVSGLIGNGGFSYLFEHNLRGDPDFAFTANAFRSVGCPEATNSIEKTLALFPNSRPPATIEERLAFYLKHVRGSPTPTEREFFAADKNLKKMTAAYIRRHSSRFAHLDGRRPAKKLATRVRNPPSRSKMTGATIAQLPRWAQVAMAARCAQQVLPLLAQYWPGAARKRFEAVQLAIALATQSAAEACAMAGLQSAITDAVMTAGAALISEADASSRGESKPGNAYEATIASFVAKAAENAAQSAHRDAERAQRAAAEAWYFATSAAVSAERGDLVTGLQEDLRKLHRKGARDKWTGSTKVSSDIWSTM